MASQFTTPRRHTVTRGLPAPAPASPRPACWYFQINTQPPAHSTALLQRIWHRPVRPALTVLGPPTSFVWRTEAARRVTHGIHWGDESAYLPLWINESHDSGRRGSPQARSAMMEQTVSPVQLDALRAKLPFLIPGSVRICTTVSTWHHHNGHVTLNGLLRRIPTVKVLLACCR